MIRVRVTTCKIRVTTCQMCNRDTVKSVSKNVSEIKLKNIT